MRAGLHVVAVILSRRRDPLAPGLVCGAARQEEGMPSTSGSSWVMS